jgi:hypothetical protein
MEILKIPAVLFPQEFCRFGGKVGGFVPGCPSCAIYFPDADFPLPICPNFLEARFWTVSGLQTTQPESLHLANLRQRL